MPSIDRTHKHDQDAIPTFLLADVLTWTEQATAPSSPAANDLVLYAFDVGGTTILAAKDSAGTVIDVTGRIGARVRKSTAVAVANNTVVVPTFDTERWDVGGCHSTSSNTGRLTAPLAGKYGVWAHVAFSTDTDYTSLQVLIRLNGATFLSSDLLNVTYASGERHVGVSTEWNFALNDYVEVVVVQVNTGAGAEEIVASQALTPEFALHYLGN